jgi:trehalose/maltose transport system substrate-binding protein
MYALKYQWRTIQMRAFLTSLLLILSLLLAACGGGEPAAEPAPDADTPSEEEAAPEGEAAEEDGEAAASFDIPAPAVPNAETASEYSGTSITYYGDSVGLGAQMDEVLTAQFMEDTGINVEVIRKPQDATENYSTYQRFFQGQSTDIDVMMLDVIWPGAFAPHLVDLSDAMAEEAAMHYETIIENNTVDGALVAIPWFADFGMLYYRTDLLEQYGYDAPPATWNELEEMAQAIQDGEREEGNDTFTGFVWQGAAYEGLTCDALEWIYSHGGGAIIEDGEITLNNPQAIEALNRAAGWVGTISPEGVVSYREEDARGVFQGGNAACMRNWPYAYAAGQEADSPIRDQFDVAPLPVANEGEPAGTVGGWQLGVSAYSQNPEASIEFVRYMASPEVQKWRALVGSQVPTIPEVAQDEEVLEALPFLEPLEEVVRVTRPSRTTGQRYNEASTAFFQGVYEVLQGADANEVLPRIEQRLERITR